MADQDSLDLFFDDIQNEPPAEEVELDKEMEVASEPKKGSGKSKTKGQAKTQTTKRNSGAASQAGDGGTDAGTEDQRKQDSRQLVGQKKFSKQYSRKCRGCHLWFQPSAMGTNSAFCIKDKHKMDQLTRMAKKQNKADMMKEIRQDENKCKKALQKYFELTGDDGAGSKKKARNSNLGTVEVLSFSPIWLIWFNLWSISLESDSLGIVARWSCDFVRLGRPSCSRVWRSTLPPAGWCMTPSWSWCPRTCTASMWLKSWQSNRVDWLLLLHLLSGLLVVVWCLGPFVFLHPCSASRQLDHRLQYKPRLAWKTCIEEDPDTEEVIYDYKGKSGALRIGIPVEDSVHLSNIHDVSKELQIKGKEEKNLSEVEIAARKKQTMQGHEPASFADSAGVAAAMVRAGGSGTAGNSFGGHAIDFKLEDLVLQEIFCTAIPIAGYPAKHGFRL